tara:strand:- start:1397 stop:1831 length:435 start_codon:yes stop_codon:yes gene_type:complete
MSVNLQRFMRGLASIRGRRPTKIKGLSDNLDQEFRQNAFRNNLIRQSRIDSLGEINYNEPTASVSGVMNNAQVMGGIAGAATSLNNPFAEGADVDAFTNVPPSPSAPSSFNDESQGIANGVFGNIFDRQDSVQAPLMFKIKNKK